MSSARSAADSGPPPPGLPPLSGPAPSRPVRVTSSPDRVKKSRCCRRVTGLGYACKEGARPVSPVKAGWSPPLFQDELVPTP
eukprot:750759-Hanusia_phi.AAC.2